MAIGNKRTMRGYLTGVCALALAGCATTMGEPRPATASTSSQQVSAPQASADIGTFFERYDQAQLALSPLSKAYRGIRDEDYGRWGDFSDAAEIAEERLQQQTAQTMNGKPQSPVPKRLPSRGEEFVFVSAPTKMKSVGTLKTFKLNLWES